MSEDQGARQALPSSVGTLEALGNAADSAVPLPRAPLSAASSIWRTRISVVIPAVNEADNLRWLLPQLATVDEVIVVDGESTDGTEGVLRELCPHATLVRQPPRGKGAALRAGFAAATGEVVVMLDADGSMDPLEIDSFVALIARGYDVVKGSRHSCGGGSADLDTGSEDLPVCEAARSGSGHEAVTDATGPTSAASVATTARSGSASNRSTPSLALARAKARAAASRSPAAIAATASRQRA